MVPFIKLFYFHEIYPYQGMDEWVVLSLHRWKSPYFKLIAEELVLSSLLESLGYFLLYPVLAIFLLCP